MVTIPKNPQMVHYIHLSTRIGVLTQDSRTIQLQDICKNGFEMTEGHFVYSLDKALDYTQ